jgi:hypothetical protein
MEIHVHFNAQILAIREFPSFRFPACTSFKANVEN